jgi:hypothetical protein
MNRKPTTGSCTAVLTKTEAFHSFLETGIKVERKPFTERI